MQVFKWQCSPSFSPFRGFLKTFSTFLGTYYIFQSHLIQRMQMLQTMTSNLKGFNA